MALSVSSARIFNGNVPLHGYWSSSGCAKCICCPYGYHIDLDFVRYCEAVSAGSAGDRSTIERRKKKERRRQCQSMEFLLGLINPTLCGLEAESPKTETLLTDGVITALPRSSSTTASKSDSLSGLDLSDVVGDFEATLKRSLKNYTSSDQNKQAKNNDVNSSIPNQIYAQLESIGTSDLDGASVFSSNTNPSTGTLQNIREQMAASLERMRELEQQVKAIPMLQVQVSVLKEEKRNLLRQVDDFNRSQLHNSSIRLRSNSLLEDGFRQREMKNSVTSTRDMGTLCTVMTRDVGVSHRQTQTRDVGMVTSSPVPESFRNRHSPNEKVKHDRFQNIRTNAHLPFFRARKLERSRTQIEFIMPSFSQSKSSKATQSEISLESFQPLLERKNSLNRCINLFHSSERFRDFGVNTERCTHRPLQKSIVIREEILPEKENEPNVRKLLKMRSKETMTTLETKDILTADDCAILVKDALNVYKNSLRKLKVSKESQCRVDVKDKQVQASAMLTLRSSIGITAKPKTCDVGTDVKIGASTKSVAVGPDPTTIHSISLNSMNSRSHSFNYGDMRSKRTTTKSVGVVVDDLIKTTAKSTDTFDLLPKRREFGTSPLRKKFTDVSVGESVRPHITISCSANYCDNCKETINNLAKQISNNMKNNASHQSAISRIPRPSNVALSIPDNRRQFKRQDTYTKIPSGLIKYDSDNKDQYDNNLRLEQLETTEPSIEKSDSQEVHRSNKNTEDEGKHVLPDSALFQPIQEKPRQKIEPSKEMQAAMKVLNDNLKKSPSRNISYQTKSASNIIQQEWFKISSTANANPLDVEDYLDFFEEFSSSLLEYIVNMTDSSGNTAMHYAVSHGNFDVVSILLDSKVSDINKANTAGYTAIMLAALADVRNFTHASVAKRLFQNADVNIRAKLHGQTALMLAVSHGRKDMTQLLLDAGAAINIQDEDGSTALMCAAEHGHVDIVRLLLNHPDCDSSILDIDGSSALKIALEAGNRDIGVLLYAHEHVNRGTSPYSSIRRSRRSSTTPTGSYPSAPVSPAASRRFHSSTISLNTSKYSGK